MMVRRRGASATAFKAREKEVAARRPAFKLVPRPRLKTPRPGLVMRGGRRHPRRTGLAARLRSMLRGGDDGAAAPLCTAWALALWACVAGVLVALAMIAPLESWGRRAIGLRDGRLVARGRPLGVERVVLLGALDIVGQVPSASGAALAVAVAITNPQEHSLALCASVVTLERDSGGSVEVQLCVPCRGVEAVDAERAVPRPRGGRPRVAGAARLAPLSEQRAARCSASLVECVAHRDALRRAWRLLRARYRGSSGGDTPRSGAWREAGATRREGQGRSQGEIALGVGAGVRG